MTLDEIRQACVAAREKAVANELDPDEAHQLLTLLRRREQRGNVRLWPGGPLGRWVGDVGERRTLADFLVTDVERAIAREAAR